MAVTVSSSFHSYSDAKHRDFEVAEPSEPGAAQVAFAILEHKLSYRFYLHLHPYVSELVRRLVKESIPGLQAADTQYDPNADGTLVALPNSTLVALADGVQVILPDGTQVTLEDGVTVTLPGSILATRRNGLQFVRPDGEREALFVNTNATLSYATQTRRSDGTQVDVPKDTPVTLLGVKPRSKLYEKVFSPEHYNPNPDMVDWRYPVKDLDFASSGAYAVYNWEVFFHTPLTLAIHLSKNQRFEEAQRWFHYIFDPTDDSYGPTPERFWKVKPFQYTDVKLIEELLVNLSTGEDPELRRETENCIDAWREAPFRPHVVARYRQSAYMFKTVMAYLDNLIAWGDTLFRQDTGESTNEATQLFVLAANILGPRPQPVPRKGSVRPQTYDQLRKNLDKFGNALRDLETDIPFDIAPHPRDVADVDRLSTVRSLGQTLYFCVPRNDKLLGYWDTVADRLFKIRNSLNIQGIFRQLPLFEPPIDPALLARAVAAGLDVGAVISGINQPLPLVRFQFMVQKAAEICQEVKSLGNNLLAAIEKEDNEALAILRARHEQAILGMAKTVKYAQFQEATKAREGLVTSFANAVRRYTYYERLLGEKDEDISNKIAEIDDLDLKSLDNALDEDGSEKMKFQTSEPEVESHRAIEVDIAEGVEGIKGGRKISSHEWQELNLLEGARGLQDASAVLDFLASELSLIPQFDAHGTPLGVGVATGFGGVQLSKMLSMMSSGIRFGADQLSYQASKTAKLGSYARREQEWAFQSNLAAGEITQIYKQLRAAQIREAIAEREWKTHQRQISQALEIEAFLTDEKDGKMTNQAFYAWMKREVKGLYAQVFQFAFDVAKKAERALQHELGDPNLSFIQYGYLAGKEGLLAGEKLYLDLKRMEMAYHDLNRREYELTKHVSLLQVGPLALLQLRATGRCTFSLPEEIFDMDGPGHYFRRIKTVAVSIPCVTGPYTSVNCRLTLLNSSIRTKGSLQEGSYARESAEDPRFNDYYGSLQSIVTSSAQNDSGLFETNLRDERYLPFEGSGVVGEWQLELPADPSKDEPRQFDYDTIADVILHIRYTAREGGNLLRSGAIANLTTCIDEAAAAGSVRLFSVRHEFPAAWASFKNQKLGDGNKFAELTLSLKEEHYPFWSKGRLKRVEAVEILAQPGAETKSSITVSATTDDDTSTKASQLVKDTTLGDLRRGKLKALPDTPVADPYTLYLDDNSMQNLWLALQWANE